MPDEPVVTPAPETMEFEFAGSKYTGTAEEIIEKMGKSIENANLTLKERKDTIDSLSQQLATKATPPPAAGAFDTNRWGQLISNDGPQEALKYQLADLLGVGDGQTAVNVLRHVIASTQRAEVERELYAFRTAIGLDPDARMDDATSNQITTRVQQQGKPLTRDALLGVYHDLIAEGKIQAVKSQEEEEPKSARRKAPPNTLGTGGGGTTKLPSESDLMGLPMDKLKEVLRANGMRVA